MAKDAMLNIYKYRLHVCVLRVVHEMGQFVTFINHTVYRYIDIDIYTFLSVCFEAD